MKTKNEYIEILAAELKELSAGIDALMEQADKAGNLVKQNYAADLEALRAKYLAATEKMKELEEAGDDAWEASKKTAETVWDDLRSGLSEVAAKFK